MRDDDPRQRGALVLDPQPNTRAAGVPYFFGQADTLTAAAGSTLALQFTLPYTVALDGVAVRCATAGARLLTLLINNVPLIEVRTEGVDIDGSFGMLDGLPAFWWGFKQSILLEQGTLLQANVVSESLAADAIVELVCESRRVSARDASPFSP